MRSGGAQTARPSGLQVQFVAEEDVEVSEEEVEEENDGTQATADPTAAGEQGEQSLTGSVISRQARRGCRRVPNGRGALADALSQRRRTC